MAGSISAKSNAFPPAGSDSMTNNTSSPRSSMHHPLSPSNFITLSENSKKTPSGNVINHTRTKSISDGHHGHHEFDPVENANEPLVSSHVMDLLRVNSLLKNSSKIAMNFQEQNGTREDFTNLITNRYTNSVGTVIFSKQSPATTYGTPSSPVSSDNQISSINKNEKERHDNSNNLGFYYKDVTSSGNFSTSSNSASRTESELDTQRLLNEDDGDDQDEDYFPGINNPSYTTEADDSQICVPETEQNAFYSIRGSDSKSYESMDCSRFIELMDNDTHIDLRKMRLAAKSGVPDVLRGEVWKYLLGVVKTERSDELTLTRDMEFEYEKKRRHVDEEDEVARRVRGELKRRSNLSKVSGVVSPLTADEDEIRLYIRVIGTYINVCSGDVQFNPDMVYLLTPFVHVLEKESDIFYCFQSLILKHETFMCPQSLSRSVANFMMLFRQLMPELWEFFESEEVDPKRWIPSWLRSLLVRQLPFNCVLRLWDAYFALSEENFDIHPYVCLAIIDLVREELMDLEGSEIPLYLSNLPNFDIDQLIAHAFNIREDAEGKGIL